MALIERQRLAGLPGLWNHFYDRVGEILARHGLAAGGWEELGARREKHDGSGPLVPNEHFAGRGHTLYVWNNLDDADDLAYRLANAGYRVVLAPATTLYLDMAHTATPGELGVNWAAYADLHQVFDYVPLDALGRTPLPAMVAAGKAALSESGRRQVAGIEATLFSETLRGRERLEYAAAAAPAGTGRARLGGQPGLGHRSRSPPSRPACTGRTGRALSARSAIRSCPRCCRPCPT
jgi:hexosaminidase